MSSSLNTAFQWCNTVILAAGLVENALVLAVFAGTSKLHIKYYTFVVNLALADFVFGIAALGSTWVTSSPVFSGLLNTTLAVSVLTILAAAVNRYLALSLMPPARYDSLVTGYRLIGVCVILWCLGLAFGLSVSLSIAAEQKASDRAQYIVFLVTVCVVWVAVVVAYFLAFRKIKQYTPPLASTEQAGISANADRDQTRVQQTRRLLVMFVLILVTSFITWMPPSAIRAVRYFNPSVGQSGAFKVGIWLSRLLYTSSTVINPWIYWWRLEGFRDGFCTVFCRCFIRAETSETVADLPDEQTVAENDL